MEALEGVCDSMLDYRVHSDKPEKFAKGDFLIKKPLRRRLLILWGLGVRTY